MSRVDRHKNEYSKADRQAIENARSAESQAAQKPAEVRAEVQQAKPAPAPVPVVKEEPPKKQGRAARNRKEAQAEEFGILDQTPEEKAKSRKEARAMRDGKPEFHGGRLLGGLINLIGTLILIVAIVASLGLAVPRFVGIGQYVVISGSMEPALPVGSMVYTAQVDPSTLSPGDIIVFYSNESGTTPVTHRVVENHIADGEVITKGDANAQNDLSPVIYTNIIGKKVLSVPMLGYIAAPMASNLGKIAMALVIIGAYLLTVIGSRMRKV